MISLFGYGKTMQSLGKILAPCNIYDDKFTTPSKDKYNNNLLPPNLFNADNSTLEIVSPGIPPQWELIQKAKNLISDYDYFYSKDSPFSVWISGTNGKTTTTQMAQMLLEDSGSLSGGNIGNPICELNKNAKMWILETSSFTLHYTNKAKPDIYALLPITPDHISWHGSFEEYTNAKLKPLRLMQEKSYAIIPDKYKDFPQIKDFKGTIYFYDSALELAKKFNIDINKIKFKGAFLLDSIMALSIAKIITNKIDYHKINSFRIDAHKIEEFFDAKGRLFVDDSKATNIDATLQALKIYSDKYIRLILGGDNKGVSLEPLIVELKRYKVKVFAIGKSTNHIIDLCRKYCILCEDSRDLKSALNAINKDFIDDGVCLLSPACASLDQFISYKQRGEFFKLYALSL
ncbi:UDP-N-acetylmuramoyl-L-alanine--D-glutamate ligase [Helicobacter sp. 16-1353]|uniref:UDP-N-acetylmuramoyl-L-alanine--D-glutamate ligase n=1 Tax=Helicobacter sp. 16-1353 TaxID=2004996 RepID=UPI000DCD1F02|nr:UDP-N-acetylmuramoyl-L-alanine--D-glutamate ligase [Helicobacter sp. 16-1353]RAX54613.1 UDP-N-acetylmuramoyl-L-alanine--D-glutamate ligase [Helicobacter sp. 16-1353]